MYSIYQLTNMQTGEFYLGCSKQPIRREWEHKNNLKKGTHPSKKLQQSFERDGLDAFIFEIIESGVPEEIHIDIENAYLINEINNDLCMNAHIASKPDSFHTEESKEKISHSLKAYYAENTHPRQGVKHTPETLEKIRLNRTAPKGDAHHYFGKTRSDEVKKKIGDAQRGVKKGARILSEEGKRKIAEAAAAGHYGHWKGRTHTEETKEKMSKPIREIMTGTTFTSITYAGEYFGMHHGTIRRTLATGKPILKGSNRGLQFVDLDAIGDVTNINPNLKGERYKPEAVDYTHCSVEGCNGAHAGRGLCMKHYKQSRKSQKI